MSHVYSMSPIFAVPAGRIRFCALIALTTSAGDRPLACSACGSRSTEICGCLPPYGKRHRRAGDRHELRADEVDAEVEQLLLGQRRARQRRAA